MDREAATVILILLILGSLWFLNSGSFTIGGGPYLEPNFENPETRQSFSKQEYQTFSQERTVPKKTPASRQAQTQVQSGSLLPLTSPKPSYKDKVHLRIANARSEETDKEYLELYISRDSAFDDISITGWKLENSRNEEIYIGKGAYLVYSAQVNQERDIVLKKDENAFLITGRSPIGTSFRTNICSGYFEQFQDFYPSLSQRCPYPASEEKLKTSHLSDICLDYIERLPSCQTPFPQDPLALALDNDCAKYISENINYNGCVNIHKFDNDFYAKTWMIYFNRDKEFWKQKRETITLYDIDGEMVSEMRY